jgi:hypothetical protein
MLRECACSGDNENCQRCYGSGYVNGPDLLPISEQRLNWEPTAFQRQKRKKFQPNPSNSVAVAVVAALVSPRPPKTAFVRKPTPKFICRYCLRSVSSAILLDSHEESEHVADHNDSSAEAFRKPLVRRGGAVFVRSKLPKSDPHYRSDIDRLTPNSVEQKPPA